MWTGKLFDDLRLAAEFIDRRSNEVHELGTASLVRAAAGLGDWLRDEEEAIRDSYKYIRDPNCHAAGVYIGQLELIRDLREQASLLWPVTRPVDTE